MFLFIMSSKATISHLFYLLLLLLCGCTNSSEIKPSKLHPIRLYAELSDELPRATLLPDNEERYFEARWEEGDLLSVDISSPHEREEHNLPFCYDSTLGSFEAESSLFGRATWHYSVSYPYNAFGESIPFGSERQQQGSYYNSSYDLMWGEKEVVDSELGFDPTGKPLHFALQRALPLLYFHLTSAAEWSDKEELVSVTLEADVPIAVERIALHKEGEVAPEGKSYNQIHITFTEAPSAQDAMLWFNTLPCEIGELTLQVVSTNHKLTLHNKQGGVYEAGVLYKSLLSPPAEAWQERTFRPLREDETLEAKEECLLVATVNKTHYALPCKAEPKNGRLTAEKITVGEDGSITLHEAEGYIWQVERDQSGAITLYNGTSYLMRSTSTNLALSTEPFTWELKRDTWGLEELWRIKNPSSEHSLILNNTNLVFGAYTTWGSSNTTAPTIYVKR